MPFQLPSCGPIARGRHPSSLPKRSLYLFRLAVFTSTPTHSPDIPSTRPMYLQIARSRERDEPKALCFTLLFVDDGLSDITQGMPMVRVIPVDLSYGIQSTSSSSGSSATDIEGIRDGGSNANAGWYLSPKLAVRVSDRILTSFS